MKLVLTRMTQSAEPTFGIISFNGKDICFTLELPWLKNAPQISCIPPGIYECDPLLDHTTENGTHFHECFRVNNVPNRAGILIHPGNTLSDTHGCILVGENTILANGFLGQSRAALAKLMIYVNEKPFELEVKGPCVN